ncbi:MAG: hypothetical protein E7205_09175 [Tissierellaceae bacterium]|jgi:predicted HAD superfamily phosphohydrolase|uniref:hypothetical protein n=1 Tax=Clostridium cochlearium TaxID=1494 RepID=UPI00241C6F11|nr:hypothetical protein [Clostridium cochlearium]MBE6063992.1 hypothetical protein [Clostridium cochlearium]MBE6082841.1 hypothetical protein [Tissierellaceae bacterium]
MITKAYEQLKTPKTLSEIHSRFNEIGIEWNKSQIQLFLEMDKNIVNKNGLFSIVEGDLKKEVLEALDELFKERPKIPISKILEELTFTIGKSELLRIVEESDNYYTPNKVIISKK